MKSYWLTTSNVLSLSRGPLAFFFLSENPFFRATAIILAMVTDIFDGYLARKTGTTSQFGAFIDPLMDKLFVVFISCILIYEGQLQLWQAYALITRDFAVLVFGFYLTFKGKWPNFQIKSILMGKVTTTLQFIILFAITFHYTIPNLVFGVFILLGLLALCELYLVKRTS